MRLQPRQAFAFLVPERGPKRVYALAHFVNSLGFGLVIPATVLYFTLVVGLSPTEVGIGFTIAGVVGLLTSVPVGHLADRRGPRAVVRVTMVLQGVATFAYLFVDSFLAFVLIATAEMLVTNANQAAAGALIRRVGGDTAVAFRSTARAISHIGISLGAVGAGVALQIGTPEAYRTLLVLNGLTFLAGWAVLRRLPRYEPLPSPSEGPTWIALRDVPFVAYTVLAGAMSIQYFVLELPLPLWTVESTPAPPWSVSLFLVVNTVLVILFQVRVGQQVTTVRDGGHALRRAGIVFLLSCAAIGLAAGLPAWSALLVLVLAVVLHSYGELQFAAGSYALDFGLAPAHAQGQYQGLVGVGTGLGAAVAPVLLIGVVLSFGQLGWVGLGLAFLVLGLAAPVVSRWGERTRSPAPGESEPVG